MARTTITITVRAPFRNPINRAVLERVLPRVGITVLDIVRKSYIVKAIGRTDTAGQKWRPLSERRRRYKQKRGMDRGILVYTEHLLGTLTPDTIPPRGTVARRPPGKPNQVFRHRGLKVEVGTKTPYASAHHQGRVHLPQRRLWAPVRRWPKTWWRMLAKELASEIVAVIKAQNK